MAICEIIKFVRAQAILWTYKQPISWPILDYNPLLINREELGLMSIISKFSFHNILQDMQLSLPETESSQADFFVYK